MAQLADKFQKTVQHFAPDTIAFLGLAGLGQAEASESTRADLIAHFSF